MQVFELDSHVLGGVECDDAVDDVAAGVAVYGLHLGIDDDTHVEFAHVLAVNFFDQPRPIHRVKVVALEHEYHIALAVHQVQVLGVVLGLHCEASRVGQGVHDGFLVGDVVARFARRNEVVELQVVPAQLEGAVDGVATVVAIHFVATGKVKIEVGTLSGIDLLLVTQHHDVPLAIELLGGIGNRDLTHGLVHVGNDILDIHAALLQFLVFLLAGIH